MASTPATGVDLDKLKRIYEEDPAAKLAFDLFRSRSKNSSATTVDRLHNQLRVVDRAIKRGDVVALFREMQAAGLGEFLVGRSGHASRFRWSVSLISAGRAASGEGAVVESFLDDEEDAESQSESGWDGDPRLTHEFRLRPDLTIALSLPADLTSSEAARIADFVKTLPF